MQEVVLYFVCDHIFGIAAMCFLAFRKRVMQFFDEAVNVLRDIGMNLYGLAYILCGGFITSAILVSYFGKAALGEFASMHFNPLFGMLLYELALFLIYIFDFLLYESFTSHGKIELYRARLTVVFKKLKEFVRRPKLVLLQ